MNLKQRILDQAQIALDSKNAFFLFLPETDFTIDHGFKFVNHYCDKSLLEVVSNAPKRTNPLLPPFDTDIHVCDLNEKASHYILINKFMQCKGHIVISSMDESANQNSDLDILDFGAFEQVFQSFDYKGLLYYNAGPNSGCSQQHKHIQYTPIDEFPILDAMAENKNLQIYYHVVNIPGEMTSEKMLYAYKELLQMAKEDPPHNSYNFIISKGNAFYVPRRNSKYICGTLMNSIAISGNYSIWEWSDRSMKQEPLSALKAVCFPKENE